MSDKNKFCKNAGYKSVNSSTRSVETRPSSPFEQPKATIFAKQSTAPRLDTIHETKETSSYVLHFE